MRVASMPLFYRAELFIASVQKQGNGRCTRYESHFYIYKLNAILKRCTSQSIRPRSINLYVRMIDSRKQMKIIERETALALIESRVVRERCTRVDKGWFVSSFAILALYASMEVSPLDERKKESIIFWQTCTTFARKHNNGSWRGNLPCSGVYRCARFQQWNATLVVRYAHFLGVHRPIRNTVYNPRCSKLLHTRTRRGEVESTRTHEPHLPCIHHLQNVYIRLYTYMRCTHYSGAGESTRQHSVAAGLRQDILDRCSYRRRDVISILLVGRLLAANSTIWNHRRILLWEIRVSVGIL